MRSLMVLAHITLDGVIQSPGGPDEDTSGGFSHGGWIAPFSDPMLGASIRQQMNQTFDLLIGRKTYDIWAPYWPHHDNVWPSVNAATKYVASHTLTTGDWQPSVFLKGDIAAQVAELKQQPGPAMHVWGSAQLIQTLLAHDLVDVFWLMIYPITLGAGKRLFAEGAIPMSFTVAESAATPTGVLIVKYERAIATSST